MKTHYRLDEYGNVYRVAETRINLSLEARDLYNYALGKGDRQFLLTHEDKRNTVAAELITAGLFELVDDRGGYFAYKVQYAE